MSGFGPNLPRKCVGPGSSLWRADRGLGSGGGAATVEYRQHVIVIVLFVVAARAHRKKKDITDSNNLLGSSIKWEAECG